MRVLVIALAGLSTLAAGWMLIRDPGSGVRDPGRERSLRARRRARSWMQPLSRTDRRSPRIPATVPRRCNWLMR